VYYPNIAFGAACISYYVIEQPFRRWFNDRHRDLDPVDPPARSIEFWPVPESSSRIET
jgi:peptidoglycan/LPS O-acetylase OafA/YrhL